MLAKLVRQSYQIFLASEGTLGSTADKKYHVVLYRGIFWEP